MRCLVRVFWGRRPETVDSVAGRWRRTLEAIENLVPEAISERGSSPWLRINASGPPTELTVAKLAPALRAAQAAEAWSDLVGIGLRVVATAPDAGWTVEVSGCAGGETEFLLQSLVLAIGFPEDETVPEAQLLMMLAAVWEPDFGDVNDDHLLDALEEEAGFTVGDPVIGRVGYLSSARAAPAPRDHAATWIQVPAGGWILHVADRGDTATVVETYRRLRETGALQPLPRPLDRAIL